MSKKVLFFGDVGIDDAVALIYAHLSGKIDIVGIVADYGNAAREVTTRNVYFLLDLIGKKDLPVFTGSERPLTGEVPEFFPDVHGKEGLGPIIPKQKVIQTKENFLEVTSLIKQYPNELIIVNTGRLTSLSTLFILYGDLMKHIKAYYIMGGAFLVPGNVSAVAEANFWSDPVAANIVMNYAKNASIFPLNVTMNAVVTPEMAEEVHQKGKFKIIKPMLDFYFNFYKKHYPFIKGSPAHDTLTMSAVIHNEMFNYSYLPIKIETNKTVSYGQSIADFRPTEQFTSEQNPHKIALNFDYKNFYNDFMNIMTK